MNGTRVGPETATSICTSTIGNCASGVDAVRPSTKSMLGPTGGARRTKFPATSVGTKALPNATLTPGMGCGSDSAVMMRPVTACVSRGSTCNETGAVRVTTRPSTDEEPVTVNAYVPVATLVSTRNVSGVLAAGATNGAPKLAVTPATAGATPTATRLLKLPPPVAATWAEL